MRMTVIGDVDIVWPLRKSQSRNGIRFSESYLHKLYRTNKKQQRTRSLTQYVLPWGGGEGWVRKNGGKKIKKLWFNSPVWEKRRRCEKRGKCKHFHAAVSFHLFRPLWFKPLRINSNQTAFLIRVPCQSQDAALQSEEKQGKIFLWDMRRIKWDSRIVWRATNICSSHSMALQLLKMTSSDLK